MILLPGFKMTPFTRIAWVSSEAQAAWDSVIRSCASLASELEIDSVAYNQRLCSWQTMRRELLPDFARRCAEKGLSVLPVRWVGSFEGFIHYTPEGDSSVYCIIARKLKDAIDFQDAFNRGDHKAQGDALGFPACCGETFAENWKAGFFDPIWQSACYDYPGEMPEENRVRKIDAHPYSNPLLRYIGVRVGFHIPHSFNCTDTITSGSERLSLARDQGLVKLLEALLSMPMRAELLHGILTVKTPLFYVITYSIPTAEKYTIEVEGKFIPKEGTWQESGKG